MKYAPMTRRLLQALTISSVFVFGGLVLATPAWAGEIKFGEGSASLAVDESGKLTEAGSKSAVKELDKIPGEDAWDLRVWAKIDKGAPGPLYVEFWQTVDVMGKQQTAIVHRHEDASYDGGKYVSYDILLEGKFGFNKDRSYDVYFVQVNAKGNDMRLSSAKLKLVNTGREPEKSDEDADEEEEDAAAQDELDGLDAPEEEQPEVPQGPPETEAGKKGCRVDSAGGGFDGALLLLIALGATRRRRR